MEDRTLTEIRKDIDVIDPQIRDLLMKRMDCSRQVALAKLESGDLTIYRADREAEILTRLGECVEPDRRAGYLAVVSKIMETSRMYQYGILYDNCERIPDELFGKIEIPESTERVRILLTRPDRPNAIASVLSMIGDYGYNVDKMEQVQTDETGTVTFELTILGDLNADHMKKLMFQLSGETQGFRILEVR